MDFPSQLKNLRKEKKLTQEVLGRKIGVTKVSISSYENGTRTPDMETLQKLADALDTSTDYLLGRTDDIKRENSYTFGTFLKKYIDLDEQTIEDLVKQLNEMGLSKRGRLIDKYYLKSVFNGETPVHEDIIRALAQIVGGDAEEFIRAEVYSKFPSEIRVGIENNDSSLNKFFNEILDDFVTNLERPSNQITLKRIARKEGLDFEDISSFFKNKNKQDILKKLSPYLKAKIISEITDDGKRMIYNSIKQEKINEKDITIYQLLERKKIEKKFLINSKIVEILINGDQKRNDDQMAFDIEEVINKLMDHADIYLLGTLERTEPEALIHCLFEEFVTKCTEEPEEIIKQIIDIYPHDEKLKNKIINIITEFEKNTREWSVEEKSYFITNLYEINPEALNIHLSQTKLDHFLDYTPSVYLPEENSPVWDTARNNVLLINPDSYILDNLPRINKIYFVADQTESDWWGIQYSREQPSYLILDDSMVMDGITKGSRVITTSKLFIENGKLHVIRIRNGDPIVRRIFDYGELLFLQTSNRNFTSESVPKDDVKLLGKVIRVEFDVE
ncbi:helix-turn-helix domain-containing protein [Paenibacillus contaminans]|uniref:HTH cro/C1-type domain-containing protein n=1 Tax=Paenibacillus contaminans TaxID=450362 RepID=A0A329MSG5_9BACL|nr:helix-turn-helix domain-containing protein [Paenibacillus contaminans]RAV22228.1 hypothetical protein DQG23_04555 [Paenibacillus contaminans]